jgi:hypothetical protein
VRIFLTADMRIVVHAFLSARLLTAEKQSARSRAVYSFQSNKTNLRTMEFWVGVAAAIRWLESTTNQSVGMAPPGQ